MDRRITLAVLLALAAAPVAAQAPQPITVEAPWARATLGNSRIGAAYLTLRNGGGAPDRLLAVSTPVAGRAELHTMTMDGNVMRMRPVEAIDIAPGGSAVLQPSGLHIMLVELREPLRAGGQFPLTLRFERAGTVEVSVPIQPANATGAPAR